MSTKTCVTCKEYGIKSHTRCCECGNFMHTMKLDCSYIYFCSIYCASCWKKQVAKILQEEEKSGYKPHSKKNAFHRLHCPVCLGKQ